MPTITQLQYSMPTNYNLIAGKGHLTCVAESKIDKNYYWVFDSGSSKTLFRSSNMTAIILKESTMIHADNCLA